MTETDNLTTQQKDFNLKLDEQPSEVKDIFYDLLNGERAKRAKAVRGRPQTVSYEEREGILARAITLAQLKKQYNIGNPLKMEKDWDNAHDKNGRPPIGGARDD